MSTRLLVSRLRPALGGKAVSLCIPAYTPQNGFVFFRSMENGRPPDPADWAVMDVVNYFRTAGFEEQAGAFQEQVTQTGETRVAGASH